MGELFTIEIERKPLVGEVLLAKGKANKLANNFIKLKREKDLTYQEIQHATGIALATLDRISNGKTTPSNESVLALADYFSLSVDDLLSEM